MKQVLVFLAALMAGDWPPATFPQQFPQRSENASATRLLATIERFGDDLSAVRRDSLPEGFLVKHAATISTLRAEIISNELPVWTLDIDDVEDPPLPPIRSILRVEWIFLADAKAQSNPAAVWADLHAMWILSQSLWQRPETFSVSIALSGNRRIAETAAKLAGPRPAWWAEFKSFDVRTPLLRSIEYEAFATRVRPTDDPITPFLSKVGRENLHKLAVAEQKADPCKPFQTDAAVAWRGFVQRFNDYACAVTK